MVRMLPIGRLRGVAGARGDCIASAQSGESACTPAPSAPAATRNAQAARYECDPDARPAAGSEGSAGLAAQRLRPGPVDGVLGPMTREAVRGYQDRYGMPATGETRQPDALCAGRHGTRRPCPKAIRRDDSIERPICARTFCSHWEQSGAARTPAIRVRLDGTRELLSQGRRNLATSAVALQRFRHHLLAMIASGIAIGRRADRVRTLRIRRAFHSRDNAIVMHCSIFCCNAVST